MDWILIIFTQLDPHVDGKITEITTAGDRAYCEQVIEQVRPKFEAIPGLVYNLRCEGRRRPKKEETEE